MDIIFHHIVYFSNGWLMMTPERRLAICEYANLPSIEAELDALERKFLTECKKINPDKWFLNIYFTRLLWITDELQDAYKHLLEMIIENK